MKIFLKLVLLPAVLLWAAACVKMVDAPPFVKEELPPPPPPGPITLIDPVVNPERGYHIEFSYYAHKKLLTTGTSESDDQVVFNIPDLQGRWGYDGSVKLIQLYIYLKEWPDGDIPDTALENIQDAFDVIRSNGYKAILRFAYNDVMGQAFDNPATVRRHIEQLKPVIDANMGLVAVMQAGFLGAWGEWHSSPLTDSDPSIKNDVVNGLLDIFPAPRTVQVREVQYKDKLTLTNNADVARVGYHSDFFTAGMDPIDRMSIPGSDYNAVKQQSPYFFMSGEIPYENDLYGFSLLMGISKVMEILRDQHFSAFDISQNYELNILNWKSQKVYPALLDAAGVLYNPAYFTQGNATVNRSFYEFVRDHLGYRLNVREAGVEYTDGRLDFNLTLTNTGFAAPLNPRQVHLVLIDTDGNMVHDTQLDDIDPRQWQPYDPSTGTYGLLQHTLSGSVPLTTAAGEYKVGIWMPDPLNKMTGGEYDIVFVPGDHSDLWEDASKLCRINIIENINF